MFGQLSNSSRYCYGMDISKQAKSQPNAAQFCIDGGLDGLIVFNAEHDLAALNLYLTATYDTSFFIDDTSMTFWTALSDSVTEDTWEWSDQSNNTFLPWSGGTQPTTHADINCASMAATTNLLTAQTCLSESHIAVCAKANGCHSQPCQHRSTCITTDCSSGTQYTCICTDGYEGTDCETVKGRECSIDR